MSSEQAIYQGCLIRFRPIMMTTMAALLGAVPIAFGYGAGGEARQPLGLVVVGGLHLLAAGDAVPHARVLHLHGATAAPPEGRRGRGAGQSHRRRQVARRCYDDASVTPADLVEQLARHATLGAAPRAELEWLAAHGTLRSWRGRRADREGRRGRGHVRRAVGPRRDLRRPRRRDAQGHGVARRATSRDCCRTPAWSRPPGDSVAQEPTVILAVPREYLRAMIRECHEVTSILVHKMLDRARRLHVERPARREDGLARKAVGRTRARAEQPGVRHRTQRGAARERAGAMPSGRRARSAPPG